MHKGMGSSEDGTARPYDLLRWFLLMNWDRFPLDLKL